jgi:hypothetical protein
MSLAPALNGEDEVEAVARAIYAAMDSPCSFRGCGFENHAERYLRLAHAALSARRPATEAEGAIERVRALAEELDTKATDATLSMTVAAVLEHTALRIRTALAPAVDGGDPP